MSVSCVSIAFFVWKCKGTPGLMIRQDVTAETLTNKDRHIISELNSFLGIIYAIWPIWVNTSLIVFFRACATSFDILL